MDSHPALTIALRDDPDGGALVVVATGEIDLQSVPMLRHELLCAIEDTPAATVVLDAGAVTFLSSAGLAVLVTATRDARRRNRCFQVVTGDQRSIVRALHVAGLDRVVPVYDTHAAALAARRAQPA